MNAPLWFTNFLAYCLQVALLVMAGALLPGLFRLRVPRVLLACWQVLLAVCLALPVLQPWQRAASIPSGIDGAVTINYQMVANTGAASHLSLCAFILCVLLVGILARLVWLGLGLRKLRRIRRSACRMKPSGYILELQTRLRVNPVWYLAPALDGPATVGVRPACILLPERFPHLEEALQRAIACHEMLHVARRDWIFNLLEEFILALFWFHPAVAWLVHRIRLSREQTVDAQVVELTKARKPYLRALLEIATGGMAPMLGTASGFLKERQLAYRIELLVKEVRMSKVRLYSSLLGIFGLLVLAGSIAIWAFPLKTPTQPLTVTAAAPTAAASEESQPQSNRKITESEKPTGTDANLKLAVVKKVNPVYPPAAKKTGVEGVVVLRATIAKDGSVSNLVVVSGDPLLVKPALDAVRQWRYASVEKSVITEVKINFTLAKDAAVPNPQPTPAPSAALAVPGDKMVYQVGEGVTPPKPIFQPDPTYTKKARQAKIQGFVKLAVVVDEKGNVSEAKVAKSLDEGLDQQGLAAIQTWKFQPATKDGKPVSCKLAIEVNFKLY